MDLYELEKAYLSCLLNGAGTRDITLKSGEGLEKIHNEIKRLKEKGFVLIPKKIIKGAESIGYDEERGLADIYADEIIEQQKKKAVSKAVEGVRQNLPADMIIHNIREELDKISSRTGRNEIINAYELQKKNYLNTEFIVEKILPVGMTLLMGAPKMGKSWLILLMAECIAMGFPVFGHKSKKSPVLYYTLEDSVKRCKFRLNKISNPHVAWSDKLFFTETHNGTIGLINDINATKARVVIIDTFGAFSTVKDGNEYYETTKIIREIKQIADVKQVAVLIVHHTRKKEKESDDWTADIMGSQGLVGASDTLISLVRKRGDFKAVLKLTGRDIADSSIKIKMNDCCWESDFD